MGAGNQELYIQDGPLTLAVFTLNGSGTLVSWYSNVLAGAKVVGRQPSTGNRTYYHTDLLGTTRAVVQGAAAVESYDYDPYGMLMPGRTLAGTTKEGFTSKERDVETGLDYFGARYYMGAVGRWTAVDPVADAFPQWNPYNYVEGNPVAHTDRFGLCVDGISTLACLWAAIEIGATIADAADLAVTGIRYLRGSASGRELSVTAAGTGVGLFFAGGGYGRAARTGLSATDSWGNAKTLARHFKDHGADFGARSAEEYGNLASDFLVQAQRSRLPTKVDSNGVIRVYDPSTNTFGAFNPDGTTRTFFKPTRGGAYWDNQPGSIR